MDWVKAHMHFEQPALEATLQDYFHEVEHAAERIGRLDKAIEEAVEKAPEEIREVIEKLCYEADPTGYVLYRQLTQLG